MSTTLRPTSKLFAGYLLAAGVGLAFAIYFVMIYLATPYAERNSSRGYGQLILVGFFSLISLGYLVVSIGLGFRSLPEMPSSDVKLIKRFGKSNWFMGGAVHLVLLRYQGKYWFSPEAESPARASDRS